MAVTSKGVLSFSQVSAQTIPIKEIKEDKNKYYKENFYVVESTSKFSDQLLVCNNGNYFLYKSGDNKPFRKVKHLTMKSENNISVKLETTDNQHTVTDYSLPNQQLKSSKNNVCSITTNEGKMTLSCTGFPHSLSLITFSK